MFHKAAFQEICLAILLALALGSTPAASAGKNDRPLLPLAEALCEQGDLAGDSKLFDLFKLKGPFLYLSTGPELIAVSGKPCANIRQGKADSVMLVIGYRGEETGVLFFLTSLRGDLVKTARGITRDSAAPVFILVPPTDLIRARFESAKAFWLNKCDETFE